MLSFEVGREQKAGVWFGLGPSSRPSAMAGTTRSWCFTIHPVGGALTEVKWQPIEMSYLVFQEEETKAGGHHLQGFVQFTKRRSLATAKLLLGEPTAHLERMRGTADQAAAYCKKQDSRVLAGMAFEGGELVGQGKRSDLLDCIKRVREGATFVDLTEDDDVAATALRNMKGLKFLEELKSDKKQRTELKRRTAVGLRQWQQDLKAEVDVEPDDRKVMWVVDEAGGHNKS